MKPEEIALYTKDVPKWKVASDDKKISRLFKFNDFKEALIFVNKVGAIAEEQGHHPDFAINYNEVTLELWTHAVGGLNANDFIMAAKIDKLS